MNIFLVVTLSEWKLLNIDYNLLHGRSKSTKPLHEAILTNTLKHNIDIFHLLLLSIVHFIPLGLLWLLITSLLLASVVMDLSLIPDIILRKFQLRLVLIQTS